MKSTHQNKIPDHKDSVMTTQFGMEINLRDLGSFMTKLVEKCGLSKQYIPITVIDATILSPRNFAASLIMSVTNNDVTVTLQTLKF